MEWKAYHLKFLAKNNSMRKLTNNLWFWAFVLLLLINIAGIGSMFYTMKEVRSSRFEVEMGPRPGSKPPINLRSLMDGEFRFSKEQRIEFRTIRRDHHENMRMLKDQMRDAHHAFLEMALQEEYNEEQLEEVKMNVAKIQEEMSNETLSFIKDVQEICTPEQLELLRLNLQQNTYDLDKQSRRKQGKRGRNRRNPNP
jgi:hypothetical protein